MKNVQALVISLEHSKGRQKKIEIEMQKTALEWRFLNACDGEHLDFSLVAYDAVKVRKLLGFELTKKEVGCYLSHMQCWQQCIEANENVLVFEDDFVVQENLDEVLQKLLSADFPGTSFACKPLQRALSRSFRISAASVWWRMTPIRSAPLRT